MRSCIMIRFKSSDFPVKKQKQNIILLPLQTVLSPHFYQTSSSIVSKLINIEQHFKLFLADLLVQDELIIQLNKLMIDHKI